VLEVDDQRDKRDELAAYADPPEDRRARDMTHEERKILAEETGDEGER
jgi:hypothetical protein